MTARRALEVHLAARGGGGGGGRHGRRTSSGWLAPTAVSECQVTTSRLPNVSAGPVVSLAAAPVGAEQHGLGGPAAGGARAAHRRRSAGRHRPVPAARRAATRPAGARTERDAGRPRGVAAARRGQGCAAKAEGRGHGRGSFGFDVVSSEKRDLASGRRWRLDCAARLPGEQAAAAQRIPLPDSLLSSAAAQQLELESSLAGCPATRSTSGGAHMGPDWTPAQRARRRRRHRRIAASGCLADSLRQLLVLQPHMFHRQRQTHVRGQDQERVNCRLLLVGVGAVAAERWYLAEQVPVSQTKRKASSDAHAALAP